MLHEIRKNDMIYDITAVGWFVGAGIVSIHQIELLCIYMIWVGFFMFFNECNFSFSECLNIALGMMVKNV